MSASTTVSNSEFQLKFMISVVRFILDVVRASFIADIDHIDVATGVNTKGRLALFKKKGLGQTGQERKYCEQNMAPDFNELANYEEYEIAHWPFQDAYGKMQKFMTLIYSECAVYFASSGDDFGTVWTKYTSWKKNIISSSSSSEAETGSTRKNKGRRRKAGRNGEEKERNPLRPPIASIFVAPSAIPDRSAAGSSSSSYTHDMSVADEASSSSDEDAEASSKWDEVWREVTFDIDSSDDF